MVEYSIGPTPLRTHPLYSSLSMLASTLLLNMAPCTALCFLNTRYGSSYWSLLLNIVPCTVHSSWTQGMAPLTALYSWTWLLLPALCFLKTRYCSYSWTWLPLLLSASLTRGMAYLTGMGKWFICGLRDVGIGGCMDWRIIGLRVLVDKGFWGSIDLEIWILGD